MISWRTIEDFYEADLRRNDSREVDFGDRWLGFSRWPEWRVTWLEATGEVVLILVRDQPGWTTHQVVLAGWVGTEYKMQEAMAGWKAWQVRLMGTRWLRDRVSKHGVRDILVTEEHRRRVAGPSSTLF